MTDTDANFAARHANPDGSGDPVRIGTAMGYNFRDYVERHYPETDANLHYAIEFAGILIGVYVQAVRDIGYNLNLIAAELEKMNGLEENKE